MQPYPRKLDIRHKPRLPGVVEMVVVFLRAFQAPNVNMSFSLAFFGCFVVFPRKLRLLAQLRALFMHCIAIGHTHHHTGTAQVVLLDLRAEIL